MIMILIFFILFLPYVVSDIGQLKNEKQKKLLGIYIVGLCIAFAEIVVTALDIKIPSPAAFIKNIVNAIIGI